MAKHNFPIPIAIASICVTIDTSDDAQLSQTERFRACSLLSNGCWLELAHIALQSPHGFLARSLDEITHRQAASVCHRSPWPIPSHIFPHCNRDWWDRPENGEIGNGSGGGEGLAWFMMIVVVYRSDRIVLCGWRTTAMDGSSRIIDISRVVGSNQALCEGLGFVSWTAVVWVLGMVPVSHSRNVKKMQRQSNKRSPDLPIAFGWSIVFSLKGPQNLWININRWRLDHSRNTK
ncbi:hypothetical protein FA15DRAFT_659823 [Coprinopsis marcescibilis]|uniref:Uncharacterized protein n=1 Tax=Coprinopsis marcescibilis TaxID=230819 RepID=A0A5C3KHN6_COPMA|nr:hypothetical protein FA15DRAFT_659823 [Coprinopsis marcescibilis]